MRHVVTFFYESEMDEKWEIVKGIRAHFLSARDGEGRVRFPPDRFVFDFAHTAGGMSDVLSALERQGAFPSVYVFNLYKLSAACIDMLRNRLGPAKVILFWRGRDGDLSNVDDASRELKRLVLERTGEGATTFTYGTADKEEKAHSAIRLIESEITHLMDWHGQAAPSS